MSHKPPQKSGGISKFHFFKQIGVQIIPSLGSKEILSSGKGGNIFEKRNYKKLSELINKFFENPSSFYKKELFCRNNIYKFSKNKNLKLFNNILDNI